MKMIKLDSVIVEFQGFYGLHGEFLVKELAIVGVSNVQCEKILFTMPVNRHQLPCESIRQNDWLTRNFHHISFDEEGDDYENLVDILDGRTRNYTSVLTKGEEKAKFLSQLLNRDVHNVESFLEVSLRKLPDVEYKCTHFGECALKNAMKIKKWIDSVINVIKK